MSKIIQTQAKTSQHTFIPKSELDPTNSEVYNLQQGEELGIQIGPKEIIKILVKN